MCRGGGSRAQGLVRAGVVPTTPRSLERARREMSHLLIVLCRPGNFFVRFHFEVFATRGQGRGLESTTTTTTTRTRITHQLTPADHRTKQPPTPPGR